MKKAFISQPFGMGDNIFTISLCMDLIDEGYELVYPVLDHNVDALRLAYPKINFIPVSICDQEALNIKQDRDRNGIRIIPIRFSEWIMGRPYKDHMKSKYELYGKDWTIWKRDGYPQRNHYKEMRLMEHLGIADLPKYNFINTKFGSSAQFKANIKIENEYRNIEMDLVEGYSIFDWCTVIENAENIYSVSTSTLYLYELLELKAKEINLYIRKPIENSFEYVDFLFTKNYKLHS